jgi:dienelactone hydrolase
MIFALLSLACTSGELKAYDTGVDSAAHAGETAAPVDDTGGVDGDDTGLPGEDSGEDTGGDAGGGDGGETADSGDTGAGGDTGDTGEVEETPPVDYSETGPYTPARSTTSVDADGCDMDVVIYAPSEETGAPLVVIGHGFQRAPENVEGWAEHLASWGFTAAVPTLCHSSIWDSDLAANGEEMVALAAALDPAPAIYMGQSAGGASAAVAASVDPAALGAVGLDATDAGDEAADAARGAAAPIIGLLGESSYCNSYNNGEAIYSSAPDGLALRVTDADHCDFENETDWLCTTFCQNYGASISDGEIQQTVLGLMTAAAVTLAGIDDGVAHWWTPGGVFYEELAGEGYISGL